MPITVQEREKHRRVNGSEAERKWVIRGATDEATARNAMLSDPSVPTVINGLVRIDLQCDVDEFAENLFEGTTKYANPQYEAPPANTVVLSFDISTQQTKIKQSPNHISDTIPRALPYAFTQKDFAGAIGVTADGEVEGVDIPVPSLCYQLTKTMRESDLTAAYILKLAEAAGCTNLTDYRGFTKTTLLLTRIAGSPRPDPTNAAANVYDITFSWAHSKTKTNIAIGNGIFVPEKRGWDYLWVYYEPVKVSASKAILPQPLQACVERPIPEYEMALLNL